MRRREEEKIKGKEGEMYFNLVQDPLLRKCRAFYDGFMMVFYGGIL
jgi:hypothetical protein